MSYELSGAAFSPTIEGKNKPSVNQKGLSKDQSEHKESIVFDTAMAECKSYWENLKFNDQRKSYKLIYDDNEKVKAFLSCPILDIQYSDLVHEFKKISNTSSVTQIRQYL